MIYTVSARGKTAAMSILRFLAREYPHLAIAEVESVFGFVERCPLYGGRPFTSPELSQDDVASLERCGVGLRLPLSNHVASREEYERCRPLLEKYHRKGNSVIVTRDDLARWIRTDFPYYEIEASVIKEVDTLDGIDRALETYDYVVLPMRLNQDAAFLDRISRKDRVTLFANAGCALTCPARICYASFSSINRTGGGRTLCSFDVRPRELYGMLEFDLAQLTSLGFSRFKLLRRRAHGLTGF